MVSGAEERVLPELLVVGPAFFEAFVPADAHPEPGIEKYVADIPLGLGGALNSASVAAALGVSTGFMHPRTAWPVDSAISECCRRAGIIEFTWGQGGRPFVTLVWSDAHDRAFISSADWDLFSDCPAFPPVSHVHIGGLTEFNMLRRQAFEARTRGATLSTCAGWDPPILDRMASETTCPLDLLFMNRAEAVRMCGSLDVALERLPGRVAREVVVTDGAAGAMAASESGIVTVAAPKAEVIDPTGAGDALAAAYVSAMVASRGASRAFDRNAALADACRVASKVVGIRGGVVMDPRQVTSR